ncbi:MAG: DNA repair protein RadC [Clostridia bacterium]|nr:DNA repair protein RadC [Clostridia bacterium]
MAKKEKKQQTNSEDLWYMRPEKVDEDWVAEGWYVDPAELKGRDLDPKTGTFVRETAQAYGSQEESLSLEPQKNPNAGHRERLRERFRENQNFDGFQDHEILELLLTYGSPRRDTKLMAKELLGTYGNLKGVFEARPESLMRVENIGEIQATLISMMMPLTRALFQCEMVNPEQIANRRDLERYCLSLLMGKRAEEFWVICVNAQCRILGQRRIAQGSLSEVSAYPRMVMETVLDYNAHSVFFCHNHPGGTCAPSAEDIATTVQLQRILGGVEVMTLDHMIIAGGNAYSMAQHGDIEFGARGRR